MTIIAAASWLLLVLGLAVAVIGTLATRSWRRSMPTMLDLWTGAGLLRLSAEGTWQSIALAASVIAARHLLTSIGTRRGTSPRISMHGGT